MINEAMVLVSHYLLYRLCCLVLGEVWGKKIHISQLQVNLYSCAAPVLLVYRKKVCVLKEMMF